MCSFSLSLLYILQVLFCFFFDSSSRNRRQCSWSETYMFLSSAVLQYGTMNNDDSCM